MSLARYRITAIIAKASMTREMWRCQPARDLGPRCRKVGKAKIPESVAFQTKPAIALDQIRAAQAAGIAPAVVLAEGGYGVGLRFVRASVCPWLLAMDAADPALPLEPFLVRLAAIGPYRQAVSSLVTISRSRNPPNRAPSVI